MQRGSPKGSSPKRPLRRHETNSWEAMTEAQTQDAKPDSDLATDGIYRVSLSLLGAGGAYKNPETDKM